VQLINNPLHGLADERSASTESFDAEHQAFGSDLADEANFEASL